MLLNFDGVTIALHMLLYKMNLIWSWTRQITGINSSPYKNKHHLQSDESDWHPSPLFLSQLFEMNFVEVWQSSQTRRFFLIQRGVPGAVLMSPNAIASFSLWSHKGNTFSSSSTSSSTNSVQGTYRASCINPDNLCSFG